MFYRELMDRVDDQARELIALRARVAEAELLLREWHSLYQCTVEEEEHRLRRTGDWLRASASAGPVQEGEK